MINFNKYFELADKYSWDFAKCGQIKDDLQNMQLEIVTTLFPELKGIENCKFFCGEAILPDKSKIKLTSNRWRGICRIKIQDGKIESNMPIYKREEMIDEIIFNSKEYKEFKETK